MIGPLLNGRGGFLAGQLGAPKIYPALTAIAQEYTMSGLDGDAEGGYYILGMLYLNGAASSYALRTNGLTTNQKGAYTSKDLAPATNVQVATLQFTAADALTAPASPGTRSAASPRTAPSRCGPRSTRRRRARTPTATSSRARGVRRQPT